MDLVQLIEIIVGNVLAAVMLYLYLKQTKRMEHIQSIHSESITAMQDKHDAIIAAKDKQIKDMSDSINDKVIGLLSDLKRFTD